MKYWVRNIAAVVAGLVVGSVVNMAIVTWGPAVVPPPAGVDASTAERLAAGIHLFEPKHFLVPFLAHALGTLADALVAFPVAAPAWFIVVDLAFAYLPMAWLATVPGRRLAGDAQRQGPG